jgi:hypothetical protein
MKKRSGASNHRLSPDAPSAYLRYLEQHPLARNLNREEIVERASALAEKIFCLTATEFSSPHEPRMVARQLGITVERVAAPRSSRDDSIPPRAFVAESRFREKKIRIHVRALDQLRIASQAKRPAHSWDATTLEELALAHEIFHFLLERYKEQFGPQAQSGRAGALTEEIAAHEFARLSLRLDSVSPLLGASADKNPSQ